MINGNITEKFENDLRERVGKWLLNPIVLKHVEEENQTAKKDEVQGTISFLYDKLNGMISLHNEHNIDLLETGFSLSYKLNEWIEDKRGIFDGGDNIVYSDAERIEKQKVVLEFVESVFQQVLVEYIETTFIKYEEFSEEDWNKRESKKEKMKYMLYEINKKLGSSLKAKVSEDTMELIQKYIGKIAFENKINPKYYEDRNSRLNGFSVMPQRDDDENSNGFVLNLFLENYLNRIFASKLFEVNGDSKIQFEEYTMEPPMYNKKSQDETLDDIIAILKTSIDEHRKYQVQEDNATQLNNSLLLLKVIDDVIIDFDMVLYEKFYRCKNKISLSKELLEQVVYEIREEVIVKISQLYNPQLESQYQIDIMNKNNMLWAKKTSDGYEIKFNNELISLYNIGDKYLFRNMFWKEVSGSAFMLGTNEIDNNKYMRYFVSVDNESLVIRYSEKINEEKQKRYTENVLDTLNESILNFKLFNNSEHKSISSLKRYIKITSFGATNLGKDSDNMIRDLQDNMRAIILLEEMEKIPKVTTGGVKNKI